jgi:hypothetical protein
MPGFTLAEKASLLRRGLRFIAVNGTAVLPDTSPEPKTGHRRLQNAGCDRLVLPWRSVATSTASLAKPDLAVTRSRAFSGVGAQAKTQFFSSEYFHEPSPG